MAVHCSRAARHSPATPPQQQQQMTPSLPQDSLPGDTTAPAERSLHRPPNSSKSSLGPLAFAPCVLSVPPSPRGPAPSWRDSSWTMAWGPWPSHRQYYLLLKTFDPQICFLCLSTPQPALPFSHLCFPPPSRRKSSSSMTCVPSPHCQQRHIPSSRSLHILSDPDPLLPVSSPYPLCPPPPNTPHLPLSPPQLTQVKLDYDLGSIAPAIDNKTMHFHYGTHYKAYVDNLNKATAAATNDVRSKDLTSECCWSTVCRLSA
jgi:hypothetical protein